MNNNINGAVNNNINGGVCRFLSKMGLGVSLILSAPVALQAQETISFSDPRWEIAAEMHEVKTHAGKEALFIGRGKATLKNIQFSDGIIEYDVMADKIRGFSGVQWRIQPDHQNKEEFYLRHHQSGNPDANQYSPVFNGMSAWQIYYGKHYSTPVKYKVNEWMHVKLVVSGNQAEVYIDSEEPVLFIDDLKSGFDVGLIGLYTNLAPVYFANFTYHQVDAPKLKGKALAAEKTPDNLIAKFDVSNTFDKTKVEGDVLDKEVLETSWTPLKVETKGIANLSRVAKVGKGNNTVLAKFVIISETDQTKYMKFGYSDAAKVFLNGKAIYQGSKKFRSRDYRYLGTVGFFDGVYLSLKKGRNIVHFAVSETFGGWAVAAALDSMDGLQIE